MSVFVNAEKLCFSRSFSKNKGRDFFSSIEDIGEQPQGIDFYLAFSI